MCQRLTESSQKVCWAKYDRRWGDWQNARKNIYKKLPRHLRVFWTCTWQKDEDLDWEATPSYKELDKEPPLMKPWRNCQALALWLWWESTSSGRPREETQNGRGIGILSRTTETEQCTQDNLICGLGNCTFKACNYSRYLKARVVSPAMVKVSERKHPSYSWNQSHCHQGSLQTLVKSVIHCLRMLFAFICRKKHIFKREGLLWRNSILQILTQQSSCHA